MSSLLSKKGVLERIRQMDPYEFEELVGELWERRGFNIDVRKGSGDRGIDIEAYTGTDSTSSEKILIQVKRYGSDNKVGSKQIREYATIYQQENYVDSVVLVTSGYFTDEARELAIDLNVDTINGDDLFRLLDSECPDLAVKYLNDLPNPSDKEISVEEFSVNESPFDPSRNWKHVNPNQTHFNLCPECDSESVWFGKLNGIRHLKCETCNSRWRKEENEVEKGVLFSRTKTIIGWREIAGPNENKFQSKTDWRH